MIFLALTINTCTQLLEKDIYHQTMMTSTSTSFCKNALVLLLLSSLGYFCSTAADPTDGFTRVSLTNNNFKLQKPYDKSVAERYSKVDGVETFKVYTNDKPFEQGSPTRPRTEIRVTVCIYSSLYS